MIELHQVRSNTTGLCTGVGNVPQAWRIFEILRAPTNNSPPNNLLAPIETDPSIHPSFRNGPDGLYVIVCYSSYYYASYSIVKAYFSANLPLILKAEKVQCSRGHVDPSTVACVKGAGGLPHFLIRQSGKNIHSRGKD